MKFKIQANNDDEERLKYILKRQKEIINEIKNSLNQQKEGKVEDKVEDKERFTIDEIDNSTIVVDKNRNAIHVFKDRVCKNIDELMELIYEIGIYDGRWN